MQRVEIVLPAPQDGGVKPFGERFDTRVHVVPSVGMRYQADPRMILPVPQAPKRKSTSQSGATGKALPKNPYSIEVLRRAIDILAVFSHAKPTMSLAEIVAAVQLPKTTVLSLSSCLNQ